jgi:hypothetical protein
MDFSDRVTEFRHKHPAMVGYVASAVIFTGLMYMLLFDVAQSNREFCDTVTRQAVEVNERGPAINRTAEAFDNWLVARLDGDRSKIAEGVPAVMAARAELATVDAKQVTVPHCANDFPNPWPFN